MYQLCRGALLPGPCGVAVSILLQSAVSCPHPMLRETHRSRFSPALEVAGCGVGERPWSPLRVKMEVAALRREVCFANSRHSAKVAYGRFEARRPVEPAVEDRKRRLLDARRTSIEYQMAIPGGRRHLRHVRAGCTPPIRRKLYEGDNSSSCPSVLCE